MKKNRQSNIELLKILSSLGVILLHYNKEAFACVPTASARYQLLILVESIFINSVNVFMLISGYFMIKSERINLRKPLRLLIELAVFSGFVYLLQTYYLYHSLSSAKLIHMVAKFLPSAYFIILYIAVYQISPFVNKMMHSLSRKNINILMCTVFILFSVWPYAVDLVQSFSGHSLNGASTIGLYGSQGGYTFVNFLLMYMIGAYINIAQITNKKHIYIYGGASVILWTIIYAMSSYFEHHNISIWVAWEYCNPLIVLSAVFVFLFFNCIDMQSCGVVNHMARAPFCVYIINISILQCLSIEHHVTSNGYIMLLHMAVSAVFIFLIGWGMQSLFDLAALPISKYLDKNIKQPIINADK